MVLLALAGFLIAVYVDLSAPNRVKHEPSSVAAGTTDIEPWRYTAPPRSAVREADAIAAVSLNAANPIIPDALFSASPFIYNSALPAVERARAEHCLTLAVYYEAAIETQAGQRAVAQVVLNRVRHSAYPRTVCGVVFQGSARTTGCQFTFTCDGSLARLPSRPGWRRARAVASAALDGLVERSVGTATHYHANWVAPVWRANLVKLAEIGTHIFYRWPGRNGLPQAFDMPYRGQEQSAFDVPLKSVDGDVGPVAAGITSGFEPTPDVDGLERLEPPPITADARRSELIADQQRGTLKANEGQTTLGP